MLLVNLKQFLVITLITLFPYNKNLSGSNYEHEIIPHITLQEVVIKAKSYYKSKFLDYKLQPNLNTNVTHTLREALAEFKGPKATISSLRRFGNNSRHCHGKAVDFQWNTDLIDYLVSPEGTAWREKYGFTFYIEATPGSSCLLPYKNDINYAKYVFENPNATGPHIHLNLK